MPDHWADLYDGNSTDMNATFNTNPSPTINGVLASGEWDDADTYTVDLTEDIKIYTMRDNTYVYVAMEALDDTVSDSRDRGYTYFDCDHDATANPDVNDKQIVYYGTSGPTYREGDGSTWQITTMPTGWAVARGMTSGHRSYEFRARITDLNETGNFWNCSSEIGFGCCARCYGGGAGNTHIWYPDNYHGGGGGLTLYHYKPDTWGDLHYGVCVSIPPQINSVTDTPDPQEYNQNVNITVNATDSAGVDSAWVNINGIGNYSMIQGAGDYWHLNQTYPVLGTHSYFIAVNDTHDNWNVSSTYNFTIQDTTPPDINSMTDTPDPQEYNHYVNISANITDFSTINIVRLNITYPDSTTTNITLKGVGDIYYNNLTYSQLGIHTYFIWTNDSYNNGNKSSSRTFTIRDTTLPGIYNVTDSPDPQGINKYVNVTCDINDLAVDSAWLNVTYPNSTYTNNTMNPGTGDEWYYNTTYIPVGLYNYTIWVNDTSNNWNNSGIFNFTIIDDILPEITNVTDQPDPQEYAGYVNITCDVTDNLNVSSVWINITGIGNYSMTSGTGNEYYYNTTYSQLGTFNYKVWANDSFNNWNSSTQYNFTVRDTTLPTMSGLSVASDTTQFEGYMNVTVTVTDNVAVYTVKLNTTYPNGTHQNTSMVHGAGNLWYLNQTYNVSGNYTFTVWANDTSDNWNYSVTYYDFVLPYDWLRIMVINLLMILVVVALISTIYTVLKNALMGDKGEYYKEYWRKR